jgi:hypothetical protein
VASVGRHCFDSGAENFVGESYDVGSHVQPGHFYQVQARLALKLFLGRRHQLVDLRLVVKKHVPVIEFPSRESAGSLPPVRSHLRWERAHASSWSGCCRHRAVRKLGKFRTHVCHIGRAIKAFLLQ